ncbi:MAG: hypothetical protein H6838_15190 [Planctomycetes bacterium]|nr:hypothetical protein [Planctomycetota bacterium]
MDLDAASRAGAAPPVTAPAVTAPADVLITGRLVLRDKAGRDRMILDPETGIEMLDTVGNTVARLRFGDRPDEAMLGLGRFVRQGNGELPSVANPAVNLGHINAGSFLTLSEATAGLSLTPQHGLEHGPR